MITRMNLFTKPYRAIYEMSGTGLKEALPTDMPNNVVNIIDEYTQTKVPMYEYKEMKEALPTNMPSDLINIIGDYSDERGKEINEVLKREISKEPHLELISNLIYNFTNPPNHLSGIDKYRDIFYQSILMFISNEMYKNAEVAEQFILQFLEEAEYDEEPIPDNYLDYMNYIWLQFFEDFYQ